MPEESRRSLMEMRCFDSGRCGRLTFPGAQRKAVKKFESHHETQTSHSQVTTGNVDKVEFLPCISSKCQANQCPRVRYSRSVDLRLSPRRDNCFVKGGAALIRGRKPKSEVLFRRMEDEARGSAPCQWYELLAPESYSLYDDDETERILWCRSQGCCHYQGYGAHTGISGQQISVHCVTGCWRAYAARTRSLDFLFEPPLDIKEMHNRTRDPFWLACHSHWHELEGALAAIKGRSRGCAHDAYCRCRLDRNRSIEELREVTPFMPHDLT
jgi:hypothetical protein